MQVRTERLDVPSAVFEHALTLVPTPDAYISVDPHALRGMVVDMSGEDPTARQDFLHELGDDMPQYRDPTHIPEMFHFVEDTDRAN